MSELLTEVVNRRSSPLIIVFDYNGSIAYASSSIMDLYKGDLPSQITHACQKLKELFERKGEAESEPVEAEIKEIITGEDGQYLCRGICLNDGDRGGNPKFLIILEKMAKRQRNDYHLAKQVYCLSDREMEIVNLLFSGFTNKEIANSLNITEATIKGHFQNIMAKMRVTTRTAILSKVVQL